MIKIRYYIAKVINPASGSFIQYIRFAIAGAVAALLAIISFYLIIRLGNINHLLANSFSWLIGLSAEFFLNKFWVFPTSSKKKSVQIWTFLLISLLCLAMSNFVIYLLVDLKVLMQITEIQSETTIKVSAKVISVILNSIWDFFAKKLIVFNNKSIECNDEI